jgi:hypothetical protein
MEAMYLGKQKMANDSTPLGTIGRSNPGTMKESRKDTLSTYSQIHTMFIGIGHFKQKHRKIQAHQKSLQDLLRPTRTRQMPTQVQGGLLHCAGFEP